MDESQVLSQFKESYRVGTAAHSKFKSDSASAQRFAAGDQWESSDMQALEREQRPALVFNSVAPVINMVTGSEITNRFEPSFKPRTVSDSELNDVMTEVVRYQRDKTAANFEESCSFRDNVITGMGCVEFYHSYDRSEYGRLSVERVPINEMTWDPSARRQNLLDAKWLIRGKWIPEQEFSRVWGDDALQSVRSRAVDYGSTSGGGLHDQTVSNLYASEFRFYDAKLKKVAVFEYQWIEKEDYYIVVDLATGDRKYMSPQELKQAEKMLEEMPDQDEAGNPIEKPVIDSIKMPRDVYYRAFIAGDVVLEHGKARIQNFTYKFLTGFMEQLEDSVVFFGLIRGMRDPQKWSNKMLSQLVHTVATNPKGAVLAEKGVFENPSQARQDWGKPSPMIEVRQKALQNKSIQIVQGAYPSSMERIMEIAMEAIPRVSGVNPYMSGQVDDLRRTAQSAVQLVQRQGMVLLSTFFDSLSLYRREAGQLHLDFIEAYLEEGAIVRITKDPLDPQGEPTPFRREWIEQVEYDVIVDEAPVSPTSMMEFWQTLMQTDAFGTMFEAGLLTPDIVADIMPGVPTSIRQRMKENYRRLVEQQQQMEAAGGQQEVVNE